MDGLALLVFALTLLVLPAAILAIVVAMELNALTLVVDQSLIVLGLLLVTLIVIVVTVRTLPPRLLAALDLPVAQPIRANGFCPHCDYDLRGAPHERCPECGTPCPPHPRPSSPPTD